MKKIVILILFCFAVPLQADVLKDYQQARKSYAQGDKLQARPLFSRAAVQGSPVQDFAMYYQAQLTENDDIALSLYQQLLRKYPGFPLKDSVNNKIQDLQFDRKNLSEVAPAELLRMARHYYEQEGWGRVQRAITEVLRRSVDPDQRAKAYYLLALTAQQQGLTDQARLSFASAAQSDPSYMGWQDYYDLTDRVKKMSSDEAIPQFEDLVRQWGNRPAGRAAMERLIKYYWKADRWEELEQIYPHYIQDYATGVNVPDAWYQLGRLFDIQDHFASANACYQRALQFDTSARFRQENQYRLATTYEKLGDHQQNKTIMERIATENPYQYYWFVARQELDLPMSLHPQHGSGQKKWETLIPRLKLFLTLDDVDTALILAKHYRRQNKLYANVSLVNYIVSLYERQHNFRGAITFGEMVQSNYEDTGTLAQMPLGIWKKSYPLYFKDPVFRWAKKYGVDPLFVMALIREESRFLTQDISCANAHGLMQLLPDTAREECLRNNIPPGNLADPAFNIRVGISHLSYLIEAYHQNYAFVLAAYNGGINATNRWIQRNRQLSQPDFTERITFSETRYYVKKVLSSYWNYQLIYGKDHLVAGK